MTAIILAGGKASRLGGIDKAFLKIGRQTLINRQLKLLKKIFKKIIIVTNSPQKYKNFKGVRVIKDTIPYQGPLGGIYSGLLVSKSKYNFVLACDMPFLNLALIRYMLHIKDGFDVVVPKLKKGYETLFAIYSKNCISPISKLLTTDNLKVRSFFPKVKIREITQKELLRFGGLNTLFMNINTKQDLTQAERL